MTAATPTAKTRKPVARTMRLMYWSARERNGVLVVTEGKKVDSYVLREIEPGYAERAFEFKKDGGDTHHVALERQGHTCDCRGFVAHGHCRHASAALKLLEMGKV